MDGLLRGARLKSGAMLTLRGARLKLGAMLNLKGARLKPSR